MPSSLTLAILTFSLMLYGCSLPSIDHRSESIALTQQEAQATRLGTSVRERVEERPELTGVYNLRNARDAFAARALLARAAEKTLDVQYYIWKNDITGTLLLEEIHAAADRGVRVRVLLDDNGTAGLDADLAALNLHPNIEIRLFNPFPNRRFKMLGFLYDFDRLNRRMHNKSFTADNTVTIIGGRNVGDEYFGATNGILFDDLDVMAIGDVVDDVSKDFDLYWASLSSYPLELFIKPDPTLTFAVLHNQAAAVERLPGAKEYVDAIRELPFLHLLVTDELPMIWAKTTMLSDDPRKGLGLAEKDDLLIYRLAKLGMGAKQEFFLVSPYFVPTKEGVKVFRELRDRDIDVRVLTNSLDATDVVPVHAGYAKRREALLADGIRLYEMRRTAPKGNFDVKNMFGSSGSSLHAKTFQVDRERVFIGSFNFDPRSANLNTELGFVIEDETLAKGIAEVFETELMSTSYSVKLDDDGELHWIEYGGEKPVVHLNEPNTSLLKRMFVTFCSWLPIEPLL